MARNKDNRPPTRQDRQTSQALLERIENLHDFFDFSPAGYVILERDGRILETNLTATIMLKIVKKELTGQSFYDYVFPEDRDTLYLHLRSLFKKEKPSSCTVRLQDADGRMLYASMDSIYDEHRKGSPVCKSVMVDITDRVRMELKIRENEERFRLMAETSPDIIFQLDPKGTIVYVSPSAEKIFKYHPSEVTGKFLEAFVSSSDVLEVRKVFRKVISGERITSFEINVLSKTGTPVPLEINASPLFKDGEFRFVYGIARDITERKRRETELLKSDREKTEALALLDAIFDSTPIGLGFWDKDLRYVRLNQALAEINGLSVQEHLGKRIDEIVPDLDNIDGAISAWRRILQTGKPLLNIEVSGETRAYPGQKRNWINNWYPVQVAGKIIGLASTVMDVTDRVKMAENLRKSRDELELRVQERTKELTKLNEILRAEAEKRKRYEEALRGSTQRILEEAGRRRFIAARLVETLEKDRREVAMYLHDQIGQMLASLKMSLGLVIEDIMGDNGPGTERLSRADDQIATIMNQIKDISHQLRPDVLDTLGLIPALRSLIEKLREDAGFRIHFYHRELPKEMNPDRTLTLYRILQEALNNVAKHAQAKQVFVNLILKNNSVQLSVEDDGIGFDYHGKMSNIAELNTLGIMIMRERAILAGGELTIESQTGKGTHVVAEIPID